MVRIIFLNETNIDGTLLATDAITVIRKYINCIIDSLDGIMDAMMMYINHTHEPMIFHANENIWDTKNQMRSNAAKIADVTIVTDDITNQVFSNFQEWRLRRYADESDLYCESMNVYLCLLCNIHANESWNSVLKL